MISASEQWVLWTERPIIPEPNPGDPNATIPEVIAVQYGECSETGDPLVVYGTLVHYQTSAMSEAQWNTVWYERFSDARNVRKESVSKLFKLKEKVRLSALQAKMCGLFEKYYYKKNFPIKQDELYRMRFEFPNDVFEQEKNIALIEQAAAEFEERVL